MKEIAVSWFGGHAKPDADFLGFIQLAGTNESADALLKHQGHAHWYKENAPGFESWGEAI